MCLMKIITANSMHFKYASIICDTMEASAKVRGTGIAKRTPEFIMEKMEEGNAIIALDGENFVGFSYVQTWEHGKYVANSGLIVHPDYRGRGMARAIKNKVFQLSKEKYPKAKVFSITTGLAVMKMNSDLGYKPVTFSELTTDKSFWKGCQSCPNYDILKRTKYKMCLCTGMLYEPKEEKGAIRELASYTRIERKKETDFQRLISAKAQ